MRKSRPQTLRSCSPTARLGVRDGGKADVSVSASADDAHSDSQTLDGVDFFAGASHLANVGPTAVRPSCSGEDP